MSSARPDIIERAYMLARSGECVSVTEVKARLVAEGYINVHTHLYGSTITRALRTLCAENRPTEEDARERSRRSSEHSHPSH